jgi:hypothetical protein
MKYQPVKPSLELLFRANIDLGEPTHVSKVPSGERRIVPIKGGTFEGKKLSGTVLPGGADWQIVKPDGAAFVHARYPLRTNDNALIYLENRGIRFCKPEIMAQITSGVMVDPAQYYFRTAPQFETGDPRYAWLNNIVAVCSGMRLTDSVIIDFYEVL